MNITEQEIRDFQEAYEIDFGEEISPDEAREMLMRLVQFFELITRPLPHPVDVTYAIDPPPVTRRDEADHRTERGCQGKSQAVLQLLRPDSPSSCAIPAPGVLVRIQSGV